MAICVNAGKVDGAFPRWCISTLVPSFLNSIIEVLLNYKLHCFKSLLCCEEVDLAEPPLVQQGMCKITPKT